MGFQERTLLKVRPTGIFSEDPAIKTILIGSLFREILEEFQPVKVKPIKIGEFIGIPLPNLSEAMTAQRLVQEILDGHFE